MRLLLLLLSLVLAVFTAVESAAIAKRGDKFSYPVNKNFDVWVGGPGATGGSGLGASVGFTWKFGKRELEKRGIFDNIKIEDGKAKIPIDKDKSITISGGKDRNGGFQGSVGFEWKFGKRSLLEKRSGSFSFPLSKNVDVWVGGPGATGGSGLGASVGIKWKFGKRELEKRGIFDRVKVEDGKVKVSIDKDKSITFSGGKDRNGGVQGSVGFEWKFGKRSQVEKRSSNKFSYPVNKNFDVWVGGPGATGGSGLGASVGFTWKFGKRELEKRGIFDNVKIEDGKVKIPVGKDKSITISGGKDGNGGVQGSVGIEWKFQK